ncbi:receptor-like protein kinase FERONIA [Cornus florida]|uniref:receptor-like protein kinase FERONIA n=1 Tax=Cornus florida TaxID=4283 RepID=UPI00289E0FCE|nr:receptor-like protein kinase FERONIA [Cornus florida]
MYRSHLRIITGVYLFHLLTFTGANDSPVQYYPVDDIAVNCGSSGSSSTFDGREWVGDMGSTFTSPKEAEGKSISSSTTVHQSLFADPVPYMTAWISRAPFTYTFQLRPGQKFIRLHFYPTSYPGFERSKAHFTVKAGPYTLLSNFSAPLTADALGVSYFAKEFCLNIKESQVFNITFFPFKSTTSSYGDNVYAFINGIEIVSMPAGLYYTPDGDLGAHVVGNKFFRYHIDNDTALEMVYRLNVGGKFILAVEDLGMFRMWNEDKNYLLQSSFLQVNTRNMITYTNIPIYSAPLKVYQTAWSIDLNQQTNQVYNFTWKLPVDLGFRYLVRLHFCELESIITESGQKKFDLLINNKFIEIDADASSGYGVAAYKDYVVMMEGDRMECRRDLIITLQLNYESSTKKVHATLKGIEIFKLSNPDNSLAGVNPVFTSYAVTSRTPRLRKLFSAFGIKNKIATGIIIVLTLLNFIVYHLNCLESNSSKIKSSSSLDAEELHRRFSLVEIQLATNNFDDGLVIGKGGFGNVYKGFIDRTRCVAIKRLNSQSKQGAHEFWAEINTLSMLRHNHLVSLIGYCDDCQEMILVYEYMVHGTLADHLHKASINGSGSYPLSWEQRLNICIDAARGLEFLHTSSGAHHSIIHRDVKSSNILLDENWVAKISDFGLCKMDNAGQSHTHISTDIKGTFGYLDPEYFLTRRLTKKSDVYAFGVVLFEVLCGRPAVDVRLEQRGLALWAKHCIKEGELDQIVDPSVREQISPRCLKVFTEIATKCLHNNPNERLTMADVVAGLVYSLQPEEKAYSYADQEIVLPTERLTMADVVAGLVYSLQPEEKAYSYADHEIVLPSKRLTMVDVAAGLVYSLQPEEKAYSYADQEIVLPSDAGRQSFASGGDEAYPTGQILPTPNLRIFTRAELEAATEFFTRATELHCDKLRASRFGRVYKGWLDERATSKNGGRTVIAVKKLYYEIMQQFVGWQATSKNGGRTVIAVKKLYYESMQQFVGWQSMVNFLGRLSHPNIVKLLGYCWEDGELLLVHEFMQKGSLEKHLFGRGLSVQSLPWGIRFKILMGAARGLEFLHTSEKQIIYSNFKTSNILLDACYNAKISDIGMAKVGSSNGEIYEVPWLIGPYVYAAPEYIATGYPDVKSDLYGFGVVLVEMLTGLRALDTNRPNGKRYLVDWIKPYFKKKMKLKDVMDSRFEGKYPSRAATQMIQLALRCLEREPKYRPSIKEVVENLELIETINEKPESSLATFAPSSSTSPKGKIKIKPSHTEPH